MKNWEDLVAKHRKQIVKRWFDTILDTYPEETARFVRSEKNPFLNPVGSAIKEGIDGIIDWLVSADKDQEGINSFLDRIIRIRAVQEFKPSEALRFIADLKSIFREVLSTAGEVTEDISLHVFDQTVDNLLLQALDIYSECREKIFELRVQEVRNRTYRLLERAGLIYEISQEEEEMKEDVIKKEE